MASGRKKILFLTNSDYGQANVVLATAFALLQENTEVELHIASFHGLKGNVARIAEQAGKDSVPADAASRIIFHGIDGLSQFEAGSRPEVGVMEAFDLKPNLVNSAKNILLIASIMMPWSPEEFSSIYLAIKSIMEEVQPDLTVVDQLFSAGLTLCHHLKVNWIVLTPNTIKDFAIPLQPNLAVLWKYPIVCSALPYPIPAHLIPYNIALVLVAGYMLLTDTRISQASQRLRTIDPTINLITANELGVFKAPPPGLKVLVANTPDLDYPFTVLPDHVIPCGPIIRAAPELDSVDAALSQWLKRGPTVYVNLGTQLKATAEEALEMAKALRILLDRAQLVEKFNGSKLQILWKLKRKLSADDQANQKDFAGPWKKLIDVLGPEIDVDRVRITDWVTAEPFSLLKTGNIACAVNHGGANSFYEALCAGVPQVVLPAWADCYDFGNRVEFLGNGRWSNKKAKPRWKQNELADGLTEVLLGPESEAIRDRAMALARQYPGHSGREKAALEILAALKEA